ncbi:MAG: HAD family phosphatase [Thermoplasmatota archaeon]
MVIFDMDGTLIKDRSIFILSEKLSFKQKLLSSIKNNKQPYEKTIEIAQFLKGIDHRKCIKIFQSIPMHQNIDHLIKIIKEKKITTAIATDSYQFLANDLKQRLHVDYAYANNLIIQENIITGNIEIHNKNLKRCDNGKIYSICKEDVLEQLCTDLHIKAENVIAIGDGLVDIGMIKKAGLGIAFNAPEEVQRHADICVNDFNTISNYIKR